MPFARRHKGMGKQFYEYVVMRIVYPSVCDAVKIGQRIFRVRPQSSLQGIRCGASIPYFADVISLAVIEPINGMLAAMPFLFILD